MKINFDSLCENSQAGKSNLDTCKSTADGIVNKGLRTAVVGITEITRDILSIFRLKS